MMRREAVSSLKTLRRCAGRNEDGTACDAPIVLRDGYCISHSPTAEGQALKRAAVTKGGAAPKRGAAQMYPQPRPGLPDPALAEADTAIGHVELVAGEHRRREISTDECLAQIRAAVAAQDIAQGERRISVLERSPVASAGVAIEIDPSTGVIRVVAGVRAEAPS